MVFGHLRSFQEHAAKHAGKHLDYTAESIVHACNDSGLVFLDLWPFALPICLVSDPHVADQIVRSDNLPKCLQAMTVHFPIFGEESLALASSDEKGEKHWKTIRKAIAPGFKKGHLERSWTDDVIDVGEQFVARLEECAANGQPAIMGECLVDTTLDLILRVTVGTRDPHLAHGILQVLNAQLDHASATGVRNALARINPKTRYGEWERTKQMHDLLAPTVQAHIKASQIEDLSLKPKKDVLDWALSEHPDFSVTTLIDQVKTFILAGHDTASSTLAWIYYHLSQSPSILAKLRAEHDRVFNTQDLEHECTIGKESDIILAEPGILNELTYTTAVMREALRLYPPASAVRQADSDVYMVEHDGQHYSVAGCMLWVNHWCLHRSKGELLNRTYFPSDFR
jgi:cytochrome P450